MTQPRWRFARMTPAEINQDPVQGEFFSREADLPGRLVREAIQNSLDARRGDDPVRVRFVFSGERDALPVAWARPYLDGLRRHVAAVVEAGGMAAGAADADDDEEEAEAAYDALDCFDRQMDYLVVEDFGTRGLRGDIRANNEREQGNDFWGFFRSIGISPKGANDAGSWGLGKWVFPDASSINAYLGMTQRVGEEHWLLMGMALLKTHHLGEGAERRKYRYYGSFAAHDAADDEHWLPLPVDADDFVQEAVGDFKLERLDDPGLSVIVPWPKPALRPSAIARAVLTQYFLPIVRGDLTVEIVHPEEGDRTIDNTSILSEAERIPSSDRDDESPESLRGAVEFARWAIGQKADAHLEIQAPNRNRDTIGEGLGAIREHYDQGKPLAFRRTTNIRRAGQTQPVPSSFRVYLERDDDLNEGHDYFVRGHLRIPHMDHIKRQKARALVLVDGDSELGHLLRDAEGPAHDRWDHFEPRLKQNWSAGQARVDEVRRAAERLLQRLVERPRERQMDALADLFPGDPSRIGKGQSRKQGNRTEPRQPPAPRPSPLQVDSPAGAFVVRKPPGGEKPVAGTVWSVRFAYDTVRGNPFTVFESGMKQGSPDFSLDEGLELETDGCEVEPLGANALRFETTDEAFRLRVSGFDERDVKVEVREERAVADEDEEDAA